MQRNSFSRGYRERKKERVASIFTIRCRKCLATRWESNDWKTYENKPVKNREEFQKLQLALEPLDVKWNHVPSHQGNEGNEEADRLAREGINRELPLFTSKEPREEIQDYEKGTQGKMAEGIENICSPELSDFPEVIKEKFGTNPPSSVPLKQENSGVARRSIEITKLTSQASGGDRL